MTDPRILVFLRKEVGRDDVVDEWADYHNDVQTFEFADHTRYHLSSWVLRRICPPVDPVVEAFQAVALALHEREKYEQRNPAYGPPAPDAP